MKTHPNVVHLLGFYQDHKRYFIVEVYYCYWSIYIRTIVKEVNCLMLSFNNIITENKMLNTSFVVSLVPSLIVTRRRLFIAIWNLIIFCWDTKTILERLLLLISVLLVRYNYNNTYYISVLLIHYWTHTVVLLIIWLLKS